MLAITNAILNQSVHLARRHPPRMSKRRRKALEGEGEGRGEEEGEEGYGGEE